MRHTRQETDSKRIPLQLLLLLLSVAARHLQRTAGEVGGEDGLSLGAALAEDLVAKFVVVLGSWSDLVLGDLVLERSEIIHNLDDPQGASFIDCPGLSVECRRASL